MENSEEGVAGLYILHNNKCEKSYSVSQKQPSDVATLSWKQNPSHEPGTGGGLSGGLDD